MNFCDTLESLPKLDEAFVTIGNFDGLHLGHRSLIDSMKARADSEPLVAITFAESPRKLYAPEKFTGYILPLSYKRRLFSLLGVDYLVNLDFIRVKDIPAGDFIDAILSRVKKLHLTVGYNFRFGKDGAGDIEFLKKLAAESKIELTVADRFVLDGEVVHSSAIRELISTGEVEKAAKFIAMPFFLYSAKAHGDRIGRKIGFPTLNLARNDQVLPGFGVYYSLLFHEGKFLPAMSYIGKRPTVDGHEIRIEANVLDFDAELPDKKYAMLFIGKVRDEKKFHNLDELKEMLYNDRTAVRSLHEQYVLPHTIKDLLIGGNNA